MKRALNTLVCLFLLGGLATARAQQAGLIPVPVFQSIQVQAQTTFDAGARFYTYGYTVINPPSNTGQLRAVRVDITFPPSGGVQFRSFELTIPLGGQNLAFDEFVSRFLAPLKPPPMVTVGIQVPSGWNGGVGARGFAAFGASDPLNAVAPGQTIGLALISPGLPTIRRMEFLPAWVFLVDSHDTVTPEEEEQAAAIQDSLISRAQTLGPSAVAPGSFSHWNQVRDDLNQAIQLGWVPDPVLAATLVSQLASARQAEDASDGTTAKLRLQPLLDATGQATPGQIRQEARDLLLLTTQALIANTPDTPIPFEPKVTLSNQTSGLPLGALATVTASVINIGDPGNPPIPGFPLSFRILEGPNAGQFDFSGVTADDGKLTFSYAGQQLGTDKVQAFQPGELLTDFGSVLVNWTGGPDLVVQLLIPPVINAGPGQSIPVTETTGNIGNTPAGPSVTRYFLSSGSVADPGRDLPLGERAVPSLNPGESSQSGSVTVRLPDDRLPGTYRIGACADADGTVVELNEQNNCRPTQVVIGLQQSSNQPPDCSKALPSVGSLWPPYHRLVPISVAGITDPNGDPIAITVTKITQDEPVNGLGDGDTSPDGFGVGTPQARVRAERSGTGNGRVYAISLRADDGKGGTCNATVNVGVPHDQDGGSVPIDDGQNFDSTLP